MNRAQRLAGIRRQVVVYLKRGDSDIEELYSMRALIGVIDHISELLRHPLPELAAAAEALADVILNEWEGAL